MKRFFLLALLLASGPRVYSQGIGNGFLALNLSIEWERSIYKDNSSQFDFFTLPLSFSGASTGHEIVTNLFITPELLHLAKYYIGDSTILETGEVHPFSFANFGIEYMIAKWKIFHFNGGIKLGHYGYLSNDWVTPAYTLFIAPTGSIYTFLGEHFMIRIPLEIPIAVYMNNLDRFFSVKTGIEVNFDPIGPIVNPVSNSVFFTLGLEYTYLDIQTQSLISRQINYVKPFFKFSLLY